MKRRNYLNPSNLEYLDSMWESYEKNPDSLEPTMKYFFEGMEFGQSFQNNTEGDQSSKSFLESKVGQLISAYRNAAHLIADVNPLYKAPEKHPLLELSRFGLEEKHLHEVFDAGHIIGLKSATLAEILLALRETYCRSIAAEFTHIENQEARDWLTQKMESTRNRPTLTPEERKNILQRLTLAEGFELFLHTRYVAQKRFSLEGGEGLIILLDGIVDGSLKSGTEQMVVGMAHRGRLNVLTNIFQKKPRYIFSEFDDNYVKNKDDGSGDVKYHKGYSSDITTQSGAQMHLSLAYNPSHLEFVNPVVEGVAYIKQQSFPESEKWQKVIPVQIHGDAAIAGQGVVYETLNFSKVKGYNTGGTLHIVINNQVGFTTSPGEARSTTYATDVAKMLEAPVFHVNGDDPEALFWVAHLATEYRRRFGESVFIDIICYRKYGHNEGDEPAFTQPSLYSLIKKHPSPRNIYAKRLIDAGLLTSAEDQQMREVAENYFSSEQEITLKENIAPHASSFEGRWIKWKPSKTDEELSVPPAYTTTVEEKLLKDIGRRISEIPVDFHPNPKITKFMEARQAAITNGEGLDWATCEALAFGSLLVSGHVVRLSGQDAQRGTFTHRHAVLSDVTTGEKYCPLKSIIPNQAPFIVLNSTLSETGVLGFEYGCSLSDPSTLVVWEAQFGDFGNGAQVIIDQFISSSEIKWKRASGLVMYLPHGYEGQGPEHSSARIERFLQLCAEKNLIICNLTTPANLFHALRRQIMRSYRKPLVIMTPKSLLRYPPSFSSMKDLTEESFKKVILESELSEKELQAAEEIIFCSGKIYFELLEQRKKSANKIPLYRIEQLYPLPQKEILALLNLHPQLKKVKWVQEEPRNQGAWSYFYMQWTGAAENEFSQKLVSIGKRVPIQYIGRKSAAAPAVGSFKTHQKTQAALVEAAFTLEDTEI